MLQSLILHSSNIFAWSISHLTLDFSLLVNSFTSLTFLDHFLDQMNLVGALTSFDLFKLLIVFLHSCLVLFLFGCFVLHYALIEISFCLFSLFVLIVDIFSLFIPLIFNCIKPQSDNITLLIILFIIHENNAFFLFRFDLEELVFLMMFHDNFVQSFILSSVGKIFCLLFHLLNALVEVWLRVHDGLFTSNPCLLQSVLNSV